MLTQFLGTFELSLIYALVAIGVYISFRIVDFPDLTVDASFPLGAIVGATILINTKMIFLSLLLATLAGAISGVVTAILHVKYKIMALLASIITMTGLYSINLRIGSNVSLLNINTLFQYGSNAMTLTIIVAIVLIMLSLFLNTEFGLAMRACGINPRSCTANGVQVGSMKIIAMAISNALVGLAGALYAHHSHFADINMGTGTIVAGLASVIIGEKIVMSRSIFFIILSCIIGSILYQTTLLVALNLDFLSIEPSDISLVKAIFLAVVMVTPSFHCYSQFNKKRRKKQC